MRLLVIKWVAALALLAAVAVRPAAADAQLVVKTTVFTTVAEARVVEEHPYRNYAGQGLAAGGPPHLIRTYLKFTVAGLTGQVSRARLTVVPENASSVGFSTHAGAPGAWSEEAITWHNAPAMEAATLGSSGAYTCALTCRVGADVSGLIHGDGTYTIVMTSLASPYDAYQDSRAAGIKPGPRLVVTTRTETATEAGGETWAAPGSLPLSDAQAAAMVVHAPEQRSANAAANDYVPTTSELEAFHQAKNNRGEPIVQWNKLYAYVDGRDGLSSPSTDDLIQWGAHKWGIPVDWLRAQYTQESWWRQSQLGDRHYVGSTNYYLYPPQARIPSTYEVYESMGITQVKWLPSGEVGAGTEPLRWESTAFNIDYQAATVRYYFDGYCGWCGSGYGPGQEWNSIGAWFSPYPWSNAGADAYVSAVQGYLSTKPWTSSGF